MNGSNKPHGRPKEELAGWPRTIYSEVLLSSSIVYAVPAIDVGPIANPQIENTSTPTVTLDKHGQKGNLIRSNIAKAYDNCCRYSISYGSEGSFEINLAGWGNNDDTPNVDTTLSQDECAPGLVESIKDNGGTIFAKSWKCLPSYGALGDTYVFFVLKKGDSNTVAKALSQIHAVSPAWQCGYKKSQECRTILQQRLPS